MTRTIGEINRDADRAQNLRDLADAAAIGLLDNAARASYERRHGRELWSLITEEDRRLERESLAAALRALGER